MEENPVNFVKFKKIFDVFRLESLHEVQEETIILLYV